MNKKPNIKIHKKLKNKLLLYSILFLITTGILAYDILFKSTPIYLAAIGFLIGLLVGELTQRMNKITWEDDDELVVAKIDYIGGVIFILYILLELNRNNFVGLFVHGQEAAGVSVAILSGIYFIRNLNMRHKILKILKEHDF